MNLIFIFLLVIVGCILIFISIKYLFILNKLNDYLVSIDDKETLMKIGGINILGQKTFIYALWTKIHRVLMEKYELTKDDNYLFYDRKFMNCVKQMMFFGVLLFILVCNFL